MFNISATATEQDIRNARKTVRDWCGLREYTTEEFAVLKALRAELTERLFILSSVSE